MNSSSEPALQKCNAYDYNMLSFSEQTLSQLSYSFVLIAAVFNFIFLIYLLASFIVEVRTANELSVVKPKEMSLIRSRETSLIESKKAKNNQNSRRYTAKVPYTEYVAALDEEAILYTKLMLIQTNPFFQMLDHKSQNATIAKIVQDLIKYLEGYSIATCPYRAYEIAGEMTIYHVEKDWFDIARYSGGNPSSEHPVLPLFSIFIASVYFLVYSLGRIDVASIRLHNTRGKAFGREKVEEKEI